MTAAARFILLVFFVLTAVANGLSTVVPATDATATTPGRDIDAPPPNVGIVPLNGGSTGLQAPSSVGNMTYHSGSVQHHQKVFTIFWNPTSTPFPSGYETTINQFVQDLNGSTYYAITTQYGDSTANIANTVLYGGTWLDTVNAIPDNPPTNGDLLAEVTRAITANGWVSDVNSYFQVYTPSGYGTTASYCGFHVLTNPAYGEILLPANHNSGTCLISSPWPNGQQVDAAINVSAHEIAETVTDPLGTGWYYQSGSGEIGDLCNFTFGLRGTDGSDATLAGHNYLIQELWSNNNSGCVMYFKKRHGQSTSQ